MNPGLQLHRSITFWTGLIIILFTFWAWRDSNDHASTIGWKTIRLESKSHGFQITWHHNWQSRWIHARTEVPPKSATLHGFFSTIILRPLHRAPPRHRPRRPVHQR